MIGYPSKHDTLTQCCVNVGRRLRRRTSNNPALGQSIVFAGIYDALQSQNVVATHLLSKLLLSFGLHGGKV